MIKLIKNEEKYWEFLRTLRNDPSVRTGFIQQEQIASADHKRFMEKYGDCYYICLVDNTPAGFVGLGKFMIQELGERRPHSIAKVKVENEASLRLFESCGFIRKYYLLEKEEK